MNTNLVHGLNCSISGIRCLDIDTVWPKVREYIAAALEHSRGELNLEDIHVRLNEQYMQLWLLHNEEKEIRGCVVTEIINYPQKRFLRVVVLGGIEFDTWVHHWDVIELWARYQGCHGVEAFARRGFVPKLKDSGFIEHYAMVGKEFLPLGIH